jgi:hypothetical protein
MNELVVVDRVAEWSRFKALVLDSVSSPITKRVYNLGLDEFFAWYAKEPRAGFTKATVSAWRVTLESRGLGSVSINVRIAPELASGIARIKGVRSQGEIVGGIHFGQVARRDGGRHLLLCSQQTRRQYVVAIPQLCHG